MYQLSILSMLCMYVARCFSRWSKMIGYDNLICNVVCFYDYCLQASLLFLFCLKALFFFFLICGHNAKCTNQDSNWVYTGTILWHKGWYDTNMIWYVCKVTADRWSLMCTSDVAGNTQRLVPIGKWRKMGYGVINANARKYDDITIPKWGWYQNDVAICSSPWRRWVAVMSMSNRS